MDARFVVPISTMLAGLVLWLAWIIARALSPAVRGWPASAELAMAAVTGGLVVYSGFS